MNEIDDTEYALLAAIADAEQPLWKKRLHTRLQNRDPPLPGNTDISLQSVGRRINTLHDQSLVETEIVEPDDISQSMIIGYTLTEKGRRVLNAKRGDILGTYAGWRGKEVEAFDDRETLLQLLNDELGLNEEEHATLQEQGMEELLVFTLLYQARRVSSTLDEQTAAAFREILEPRQSHNNDNGFVAQHGGHY